MAKISLDKLKTKLKGLKRKPDEKSCGIVVFSENDNERKYLLLHYPGGHFDFPKGHVEKGEENDERMTALRELTEETGIKDVEFIEGYREKVHYIYNKKGTLSYKQVVFFLAKTKTTQITISFEHRGFHWMPYTKALEKLTFENAKKLLRRAEKLLSKTN